MKDAPRALPYGTRLRRQITLTIGAVLVIAGAALAVALPRLETMFLTRLAGEAAATQSLVREVLRGELARAEPLPALLSERPVLRQLLAEPDNQGLVPFVNEQLRLTALTLGVSNIYLMDTEGTTIASSNYRDPLSFVGRNFSYRPYFTRALTGAPARFHAVGTTTGVRGYFFAAPVYDELEIIGVIAVKVPLDSIEMAWQDGPYSVLITDSNNVTFMSDRPEWRLRLTQHLWPEGQDDIRQSRQYPLEQLVLLAQEAVAFGPDLAGLEVIAEDGTRESFVTNTGLIAAAGWRVTVLLPTAPAFVQARQAMALILLAVLIAGLSAALFLQRRARLLDRFEVQRQARQTLETRVADRTADLARANAALRAEVQERSAAEQRLRATQAELVQAGKLAALGQMSAAMSHELNQPLSVIKAYADNAQTFLERGRTEEASQNVGQISAMADRMAAISKHLRNFARKPGEKIGPIPLLATLEDALALMQPQLAASRAELTLERPGASEVFVIAGRVRLSQVIVNLISNALDAMDGQETPRLHLSVAARPDGWRLSLRDHGPGFAPGAADQLFDPFFSTKTPVSGAMDGSGLGLGLSISYNIVRDFGGSLSAETHPDGGAVFHVDLRAADADAAGLVAE